MALFVQQNDEKSELQQRIVSDLQGRAKKQGLSGDSPDGVEDTEYIKDTETTTNLIWLWLLIIILAIGAIIYFI